MKEKEIRILYHGPGISGRNSNLEYIYSKALNKARNFDYKPFALNINQIEVITKLKNLNNQFAEKQFILDTAPASVFSDPHREKLVKEMDAFVFVVDSQKERFEANIEVLWDTKRILSKYGRDINLIPYVIQYNKRDLPNILPINILQRDLNELNLPYFESVASKGIGVIETFTGLVNFTMKFCLNV